MTPHTITLQQARRFALQRLGLVRPFGDVEAALRELAYVQLDPINVCGRMHDLVLRNRVAGYTEGDLLHFVHPEAGMPRRAFEHYVPGRGTLVVFPMAFWPHVAAVTASRRTGGPLAARRLTRAEEKIADRVLGELRDRGPLTSDGIEHEGRTMTAWGSPGRLVKHVLEALFHRGDVLIAGRRDFRRVYDLPERVIPESVRALPTPDQDAVHRDLALVALRQRRLVALRRRERDLVRDVIETVRLETGGELQVLREDVAALEAACHADSGGDAVRLLAPLDPLIYDRAVTSRIWDFDYTWEVYTPVARRVRGYYALPVLSRGEIVGHVEPRADRAAGRLRVVSRRVRRGHAAGEAVRELADFLGLRAPG